MRLAFLVAIIVVAVQANPRQEFDGDFGASVADYDNSDLSDIPLGNPFQDVFKNLRRSFFDFLGGNAPKEPQELNLGGAFERFKEDASSITRAAVESIDKIFHNSIKLFLDAINEFRLAVELVIKQTPDIFVRRGWQSIFARLNTISSAAQELEAVNEEIRQLWSTQFEDEASEAVNEWSNWASEVYDNANLESHEVESKVARGTLRDFVNTYAGYLNACVDKEKENLFAFQRKVQKAADNYKSVMGSLYGRIEQCWSSSSVLCQRSVNILLKKFRETPRTLQNLTAEGKKLSVPFEEIECVKQTLKEAENEKSELQNEINEIAENANNS